MSYNFSSTSTLTNLNFNGVYKLCSKSDLNRNTFYGKTLKLLKINLNLFEIIPCPFEAEEGTKSGNLPATIKKIAGAAAVPHHS